MVVIAHPLAQPVSEAVMPASSKPMKNGQVVDALIGRKRRIRDGLLPVTVAPHEVRVLRAESGPGGGHSGSWRVP